MWLNLVLLFNKFIIYSKQSTLWMKLFNDIVYSNKSKVQSFLFIDYASKILKFLNFMIVCKIFVPKSSRLDFFIDKLCYFKILLSYCQTSSKLSFILKSTCEINRSLITFDDSISHRQNSEIKIWLSIPISKEDVILFEHN